MKPIKIGLLGIGTVGGGTFTVLKRNHAEIVRRAGRDLVIAVVADKDTARAQQVTGGNARITGDAFEVIELDSSPGNAGGFSKTAHSVLTGEVRERDGHPAFEARKRVVAFLRERLATPAASA